MCCASLLPINPFIRFQLYTEFESRNTLLEMFKQILFVELVLLLFLMESNAQNDIISQLGDFAKFGQCGLNVNYNEKFEKCKEDVNSYWRAETDPKKQECCKPMAFVNCSSDTAKGICSENEYKNMEYVQKATLKLGLKSCDPYLDNPSMCGLCIITRPIYDCDYINGVFKNLLIIDNIFNNEMYF